jgi:hypothetical protein
MMNYTTRMPGLTGVRGTHYNERSGHYFYATDKGNVYLLPTNPAMIVEQRNERLLASTTRWINLNATGGGDLQWTGTQLRTPTGSGILMVSLMGFATLDSVPVSALVGATWVSGATSLAETRSGTPLPPDRFLAIRIPIAGGGFHYVKVRIYTPSAGNHRIEWVVYNVDPNPLVVGGGYPTDVRDIAVSEEESVMFFTSTIGGEGYVSHTPRVSHSDKSYPVFAPGLTQLHITPLNNPQQMALDGSFVYVVDADGLWRIDIDTGAQDSVVPISQATGLLLTVDGDLLKAYVSTATGNIYIIDLSDFSGATLTTPPASYTLTGTYGFMTWADRERTAIYLTRRDTREVVRLDLRAAVSAAEGTTLVAAQVPWSVEVISDNKLYLACETEIGQFDRTIALSDNLVMGIGLIPFDYITNSITIPATPDVNDGTANTSTAPGYYFSAHPNLPFGGLLSLMINHDGAWESGIRFYSVTLRNLSSGLTRAITNSFEDFKWSEVGTPRFVSTSSAASGGRYAIRNPADLWYNAHLGAQLRTTLADNGHNILTVEFFDGNMLPVPEGRFDRLIFVDNTRCNALLQYPRIGTDVTPPDAGDYPSLICGCLAYETKNDLLEVDFEAWQPQGHGRYSLRFSRGVSGLNQAGDVTTSSVLFTKKTLAPGKPVRVGHILGDCDVANVVIELHVPSRVIDGFGWINLGASTYKSFTLIKGPITHTPWTSPE